MEPHRAEPARDQRAGGPIKESERTRFAAASTRFVLAVAALLVLPAFLPRLYAHGWVFGGYFVLAAIFQWMISRGIGGSVRSVGSGLVDIALVTFIVHRVGSVATMLVAAYFFAAVINTLVVGRREGLLLAAAGALAYGGVCFFEALGVLPYAPDALSWIRPVRPTALEYAGGALLMGIMQVAAALLVGRLVAQNEARAAMLEEANRRLRELAVRDPLTLLFNRRHLMDRLDVELARVRRGHPLAVVMIDLDRFKRVNDTDGHAAGDALLARLASALADAVRETDVVGRYGGDEFLVLLPDTRPDDADIAAERLAAAVREAGESAGPVGVTASVGVAFAREGDEARALIGRADAASYDAKAAGGDAVRRERRQGSGAPEAIAEHA